MSCSPLSPSSSFSIKTTKFSFEIFLNGLTWDFRLLYEGIVISGFKSKCAFNNKLECERYVQFLRVYMGLPGSWVPRFTATDWGKIELFDRQGRVLAEIHHLSTNRIRTIMREMEDTIHLAKIVDKSANSAKNLEYAKDLLYPDDPSIEVLVEPLELHYFLCKYGLNIKGVELEDESLLFTYLDRKKTRQFDVDLVINNDHEEFQFDEQWKDLFNIMNPAMDGQVRIGLMHYGIKMQSIFEI